jgi:hypothetical protein
MGDIKIFIDKDYLIIERLVDSSRIYLYDVNGNILFKKISERGNMKIPVPDKGIYFLRFNDAVFLIKNNEILLRRNDI